MLEYDFEESLGNWLTLTHHAYVTAFSDELAPYNISFRQAQILCWLAYKGPLSQAQLAHHMLIEPPSLVGTLDRMESRGLVQRKPCPHDRRKNLIHALPAAENIWEDIVKAGRLVRAQATSGMDESEVLLLKKLLTMVHNNLAATAVLTNHD